MADSVYLASTFAECHGEIPKDLGSSAAYAEGPNLGKPIEPAEIAAWDISIMPDGTGLPPGSGVPAQGARVYADKCAMCHGENGKGGSNSYSSRI